MFCSLNELCSENTQTDAVRESPVNKVVHLAAKESDSHLSAEPKHDSA